MVGCILDLDGTVYRSGELVGGASEAVGRLRAAGHPVVFATNKSVATTREYVNKLEGLGIPASAADIVTANQSVARYLSTRFSADERVFVVGERPLWQELEAAGLQVTADPDGAAIVVLGWDRRFTYDKLRAIYQAIVEGAEAVATNPDVTCPVFSGEVPDCGSLIAAVEAATSRPIDVVAGKPSPLMLDAAVERLELQVEDCLVVGDRLGTDIRMGVEGGAATALVLTGVTAASDVADSRWQPSVICSDLKDLASVVIDEGLQPRTPQMQLTIEGGSQ